MNLVAKLIIAVAFPSLVSCSVTKANSTSSVGSFLDAHPEYKGELIPEHCKITTMAGEDTIIEASGIEQNMLFRGAPVIEFEVQGMKWSFRYLIIKRSGVPWPEEGARTAVVVFDGLVDCGEVSSFNGVIFIK